MTTRADLDPEQAANLMDAAQAEARRADDARDEAQYRLEQLEEDWTHASGNEEAEVQARVQQARLEFESAEAEFDSAMDDIGQLTEYWYQEEVEGDD